MSRIDRLDCLPAAPLRALLEEAVQRTIDPSTRGGQTRRGVCELSRRYAARFGGNWKSAGRLLARVRSGQSSVTIDTADRLALLVGSNLSLLYDEQGWPRSA